MPDALKKIRAILTPAERRRVMAMLVLVVLMALAETGGVVSIMPFLSVLGRPEVIHENPWLQRAYDALGASGPQQFMLTLGLASMAVVLLSAAFKTVTLHLVARFVNMMRHSISTRLLSRYLRQPYEFFLERNPSVLAKNVLSEADQFIFELLQPLSMLVAQGTVVLAMVILVFVYDPKMAVFIVAGVGALYGLIYLLVRRRLVRIGHARQAANAGRYQSSNEALGGIKEVQVTRAAENYEQAFAVHSREYSRHSATAETLSSSPLYIVEAVGYAGLIGIALLLLARDDDISTVLPALGLYGFAAYRMLPAAQIMYRGFARMKFSTALLNNIQRDLSLGFEDAPVGTSMLTPEKEIRLEGISYAYPSKPGKPVLERLDLVIPANTSIGIAGPSGAGKSTLMDILLGLLKPQTGTLSVDGTPITSSNVADWQRAIGYVPQHIYLADASVAENIAFGTPKASIDMQAVERAARAAQIHEFVERELPQGYNTKLGDRGIRLSGGQRQRVGIARALYRDPPVLFFDEATSALDARTEEHVNDAVRGLSGSKTIVVIAHREASLHACNRVVSLASIQ